MANDFFGGLGGALGGLMSGLAKSGLAPKDDPAVKLMNAQSEVSELRKQESEILEDIGRQAFERNPSMWPQADKLNLVRMNLNAAEGTLNALKDAQEAERLAKEQEDRAREAADSVGRCPGCGHRNPEGVKFCQECGAKLGASFCTGCGAELKPGIRFCGECGARQED